jgi:hypothetical protein
MKKGSPSIRSVAVIVGSLRRGSINRTFAESVGKLAADRLRFHLVEIGDLPLTTMICGRILLSPFCV